MTPFVTLRMPPEPPEYRHADIEVARGVDGECVWVGELSAGGGPAIAGGAVYAISGDGGDCAVRNFTDALVPGVRDIEIAGRIQG